MPQLIFLFPGQGSQFAGMGRDLAQAYPEAAAVFAAADSALGFPLSQLCFAGPEEELKLTANTQPAILTHSIAVARVLAARGIRPALAAGHSLGEYSALVAAGALEFTDAVRLVRRRGELMQSAVPAGQGAMAALLGLDADAVEALCAEAAAGEVCSAANFNAAGQIVIAGHAAAVARASALAAARGGRAISLPVSAPFHCPLMEPARQGLEPYLRQTAFHDLAFPLVTNVDAAAISSGAAARDALIRQVTAPVQWERTLRLLLTEPDAVFCELGPGRVLAGLLKRADRSRRCVNFDDAASIAAGLAALTS